MRQCLWLVATVFALSGLTGCVGCSASPFARPCGSDSECPGGVCSNNVCLGSAGSACSQTHQCLTGVCSDGVCGGAGNGSVGTRCNVGSDCTSGACSNGACVLGSVPVGGVCNIGAQCGSGTCTEKFCRRDAVAEAATAQGTCKKIDLVFTVDNSQSMQEERSAMRSIVFPGFARELRKIAGLEDFRVGVDDACPYPATFKTRGAKGACNFEGGNPWMVSSSTKLEQEFACVGDIWSGDAKCTGDNDDEQPASGAAATLESGANPGFLRDDGVLVVVGITDEDEQYTPGPGSFSSSKDMTAQQIYERIVATKGGNVNRMVFLGIGGKKQCKGAYGTALEAKKLKAVTDLFIQKGRGVFWDLCAGKLEDGLAEAMKVIAKTCEDITKTGGKDAPCTTHTQCSSGTCTNGKCEGGGLKPPGAECIGGSQCQSGSCTDHVCDNVTPGTPGGPGGKLPPGSQCTTGSQCSTKACTNGICEGGPAGPGLPDGKPCASGSQCASAACTNGVCTPGFPEGPGGGGGGTSADGGTSGNPTVGLLPGGAACSNNLQCASDKCVSGFCGPGIKLPGMACVMGAECSTGSCRNNVCEGSGVPAGPGGVCSSSNLCASKVCDNGLCEGGGPGKPNTPCVDGSDCASGTCKAGLCEGPGTPGTRCTTGHDCSTGTCTNGVCEGGVVVVGSGRPNGSACATGFQCTSGTCRAGLCEAGGTPSTTPLPDGSPCTSNVQCTSGVCFNNACHPPIIN